MAWPVERTVTTMAQHPVRGGGRAGPPLAAAVAVLVFGLLVVLTGPPAHGSPTPAGPSRDVGLVLLVVDASGSMREPDARGEPKIDSAKRALTQLVGELPAGTPVGMRVFGEGQALAATPETCRDTRLAQPIEPLEVGSMVEQVAGLQARGWTPMGHALRAAGEDLPRVGRGTVILVSDGVDECYPSALGPEPCDVAAQLTRAAIDLRVHTVGLTVDDTARQQLQCIARVTGGDYYDADDADSLIGALRAGLEPPSPRDAPPETAPNPLLRAALVVAVVAGGLLLLGPAVRALVARRRRAYW